MHRRRSLSGLQPVKWQYSLSMGTVFKSCRSRSAFTLIELLVVVTIIGILASFAVPAVNSALTQAKKVKASAMISSVKTALNSYQTEYGTWPTILQGTGGSDAAQLASWGDAGGNSPILYQILIADKTNSTISTAGYNPRQIPFMDFNLKDLCDSSGGNVSSSSAAKGFKDPFGNAYYIIVDGNYDNEIKGVPDTSKSSGSGTVTINGSIAIWSYGDQADSPAGTPGSPKSKANPSKYITSW